MQHQNNMQQSPHAHDFAYGNNGHPGQQQQGIPEGYAASPQIMQQVGQTPQPQQQQQMQGATAAFQPHHDQQARQHPAPSRQASQHSVESGNMPPPQLPAGRRNAMAPAPNGQHVPRAPTPASTAATPTANGMLQGSPDAQTQPLTPHTPRTPNAQTVSSGASAPGSGNSTKAVPPASAKNRKRTNTETSVKEKKVSRCNALCDKGWADIDKLVPPQPPRISKAKEKAEAKAQADQRAKDAANKSTPQSQATPLPTMDDAALYKAPMQQQTYAQSNGVHSQAPTPQQQAPTPQQQQQQQQTMPQLTMQQNGNIDVPQFSPSLNFSFGDLGDFTQFGIENMSTSLNTSSVSGDSWSSTEKRLTLPSMAVAW